MIQHTPTYRVRPARYVRGIRLELGDRFREFDEDEALILSNMIVDSLERQRARREQGGEQARTRRWVARHE